MWIIYPKEIREELEYLGQFLFFNGKENVIRDDAPEGIKERYDAVRRKTAAIRDDFMSWDVELDKDGSLKISKPSGETISARKVTDEELNGK